MITPELRETLRLLGPADKLELAASYIRRGMFQYAMAAADSAYDDMEVLKVWRDHAMKENTE